MFSPFGGYAGKKNQKMEKVENHAVALLGYCFRLTKDRERAKDLSQDTILKALEAIAEGRYNEGGQMKSWLFKIATNTNISNARSSYRKRVVFTEAERAVVAEISAAMQLAEVKKQLQLRVSKPCRDSLELYAEGFSYEEISNLLGVGIGTVKSRIFHARQPILAMREAGLL